MLTFFIGFLTAVLVLVCLLTVLIVLMQRPKQEGLGAAFGAGVTDQVFGAQTTNVLQRGTVYLAVLFFGITLTLAVLVNAKQKGTKGTLENLSESPDTPASETAPTSIPGLSDPNPDLGTTTPDFDNIKLNPDSPTSSDLPEPVTEAPDAGDASDADVSAEVEKLLESVEEVAPEEAPKSE